jgi:uncharacterized protein with ATP-grasp and redox domains
MKLCLDCIVCFQKQALFATKGLDDRLRAKIRLLYFADNAGEVAFDRIFIEEMLRERETLYILYVDGKMSCNSK